MKIALITDQHFGVKNDSQIFIDYQREFYDTVFFPTLESHGINIVVSLGDTFDRRKYVNFNTLHQVREFYFDELLKRGINLQHFVGNHDVYFKNTNEVNSVNLLLGEYENITLIERSSVITLGNLSVLFIPWINNGNYRETMKILESADADVVFGHFEITGFEMHKNTGICKTGLSRDVFHRYRMVLSGHFHQPSSDGHIWYLGAPYEYTWADYGCPRGFHLFDTETLELTFIENPHKMFYRFVYDDNFDIDSVDYSELKNRIVRIIVAERVDKDAYEEFLNRLQLANCDTIDVVDNSAYHINTSEYDEDAIKNEDTLTLAETYVSSVDMSLDKEKLTTMFRGLYMEALAEE